MRNFIMISSAMNIMGLMAYAYGMQDSWNDYRDYRGETPESGVIQYMENLVRNSDGYAVLYDIRSGPHADKGEMLKTLSWDDEVNIEDETIKILKITKNAGIRNNQSKEDVLITGCHHAREWITIEVLLRFANYLLEKKYSDEHFYFEVCGGNTPWTVPLILERLEIVLVVVLNPSGYKYSRSGPNESDEIGSLRSGWRKNRNNPNPGQGGEPIGVGVDLNRNYPYKWDPPIHADLLFTGETYRGPSPGSEIELGAIRWVHEQYNITSVVNMHAGTKSVLYPWAHTSDTINNNAKRLLPNRVLGDHEYFKMLAGDWSMNSFGSYPFAQSGSEDPNVGATYPTSGDADDWAYGVRRKASITVELSDGFQPPKNEHELLYNSQVMAIMKYIFNNYDRLMRGGIKITDRLGRRIRWR